ncbi:MAG: hypothetical protein DRP60_16010, partial [Spirochaetes bacterium]
MTGGSEENCRYPRLSEDGSHGSRRIEGDILPSDFPDEQTSIQKIPYCGTVGLVAWNFPVALAGRKLGPAPAAGNTMIVKPP